MTTLLDKKSKAAGSSSLRLTCAQALTLYLSKQKVELFDGSFSPLFGGIWGIFGHGNVAGIGEALWEHRDSLPYFRGQNEQSMAHAAIAFAKSHQGRRVMGVTSSIGPGATNMVTAAALAHTNRLPLLLLPGDIFASRRPDPVLQQLEDPTSPLISVNDAFIPVSRYFDRIMRPEQLLSSLPQAIRTLLDPVERGPSTLALPQDVQTEAFDFPASFFEEKLHYIQRPRADRRSVARVAKSLKRAKRPLIIAGGGLHYSGAERALQDFANSHQVPVAETQAGKGALPWDHPMSVGAIGTTGCSAANELAQKADCIIAVGTRLQDFTTASKTLFHDKPIFSVNVSSFDNHKSSKEALLSDAKEGLEELSKMLSGHLYEGREVVLAKGRWDKLYQKAVAETGTLTEAQIVGALNAEIGERDIVVCAAGGLPGELHKLWRSRDPISYHVEYAYSCMGYEIAAGLGAKLAHPDREVYVMIGDGSYLMMHTELLTANQLGLKLNVILCDNRGFGCINRLQRGCGSPAFGNLFEGGPEVDFIANARSYGCHAEEVSSLSDLATALKRNQEKKQSCLTLLKTDPQASSPGYAWWEVAIAERSSEESVQKSRKQYEQKLEQIYEQSHTPWH